MGLKSLKIQKTMKTFALALLAAVASARYGSTYGSAYYGHKFGAEKASTSPYRSTFSRPTAPTHYGPPSPHAHTGHAFYPKYPLPHPEPAAEEEDKEAAPTPHNPWATPEASDDTDDVDRSGWYSPTQKYSPPKIPFIPTASYPVFGICELGAAGDIQFAQLPGKATLYQTSLVITDATDAPVEGTFQVQIKENGKIGTGTPSECAMDTGSEFNPLEEISKYGTRNPFQDPSRGRIADLTTSATGEVVVEPTFVLQNMSGKDGILGRSITLTNEADPMDVVCCTIAVDVTPDKFKPGPSFPSQKSHHGRYYGH